MIPDTQLGVDVACFSKTTSLWADYIIIAD